MTSWKYLYFMMLLKASMALLKECPHPEDAYPCYCEEDEDRTTMHCNHLQESKQISQGLKGLTDYKFNSLSIWFFDTGEIKSNAFQGPVFDSIDFSYSTVTMENPPFLGHEDTLNRLSFLFCFDEEDFVNTWSLGHLTKLKEITFEKNDIKVLQNDWITSAGPSLRSITFDNCKIEKLEDKVFAKLNSLTTIFLMDNRITSVSRSMFPKEAENLRSINLNDNLLETLPDDFFKNMPSLRSVELERNKLKTLSESVWGSVVEGLSRIFLEDNPFRCDKNMKWISKKSLPKTFTGTCSDPSKLHGKELRILTPADFH